MRYEEIVAKVKEVLSDKDISEYQKHLAIQINIVGEGKGAFYVEFNDGNINVEPFEYHDRDAIVTISADNLFAILDGSLDTTSGYVDKRFDVTNLGVINEFKNVITEAKVIKPVESAIQEATIISDIAEEEVTKSKEDESRQLELVQEETTPPTETVEPKKEVKSTVKKTTARKTTSSKKKTSKPKK